MNDSKSLPRRDANAADFKTQTNKNCNVTRYTRAGKKCKSVRTVYHFNFSGLTCPECKEST